MPITQQDKKQLTPQDKKQRDRERTDTELARRSQRRKRFLRGAGTAIVASTLGELPSKVVGGQIMKKYVIGSKRGQGEPRDMAGKNILGKKMPSVHIQSPIAMIGGGAAFHPGEPKGGRPSIHLATKGKKRFTPSERFFAGHELGHAKNIARIPQKFKATYTRAGGLSMQAGAALGSMGAAFAPKKFAKGAAIAGTIAGLPRYADELAATGRSVAKQFKRRGIKGFTGKNIGFTKGVASNVGSYAAVVGAPALTYGIRRALEKRSNYKTLMKRERKTIKQGATSRGNIKSLAKKYDIRKGHVKKIRNEEIRQKLIAMIEDKLGKPRHTISLTSPQSPLTGSEKTMIAGMAVGATVAGGRQISRAIKAKKAQRRARSGEAKVRHGRAFRRALITTPVAAAVGGVAGGFVAGLPAAAKEVTQQKREPSVAVPNIHKPGTTIAKGAEAYRPAYSTKSERVGATGKAVRAKAKKILAFDFTKHGRSLGTNESEMTRQEIIDATIDYVITQVKNGRSVGPAHVRQQQREVMIEAILEGSAYRKKVN